MALRPTNHVAGTIDSIGARLRSPWTFFPAVFALAFVPAMLLLSLALAAHLDTTGAQRIAAEVATGNGVILVFMLLIMPLLETLVLWVISGLVRLWTRSTDLGILAAVLVLAVLHYSHGIGKEPAVVWTFAIQGGLLWSSWFRTRARAFWAVCALHASENSIAVIALNL